MRVLFVHNLYGSSAPSGENQVLDAEVQLAREAGADVDVYTEHSDELRARGALGKVVAGLSTPWNPFAARRVVRRVRAFRPDVVHVHNSFPRISPAVFHAVGRRAARVLTLHNFRLLCAAGTPLRDGRICTECLDRRSVWPALRHGCYKLSRLATVPLAANIALHRRLGTWTRQVDAFIALTDFQKQLMAQSGLPAAKIHVKPNFFPGAPAVQPYASRAPYCVFAGRLSADKGVRTLVAAWRRLGDAAPELRMIGDGDLRQELTAMANGCRIAFLGQCDAAATQQQIAGARLLLVPSEGYEGFPMVLREAFAFGTPVVVSDRGPLPDLVRRGEAGAMFAAADAQQLAALVAALWRDPARLEELSRAARQQFERHYTAAANFDTLLQVYESAVKARAR